MMDKYYRKLSDFLVSNRSIKKSDSELYEYAAKVLFQSMISIVAIIFIGIAFGMIKECLYFIFVFIILRKFTGGVHANKYICCLISSIILVVLSLLMIQFLLNNNYRSIFLFANIASTALVCILSPIANINKPLSHIEKNMYRIISIIFSIAVLLIVEFSIENGPAFAYSVGMALIDVSLLIVIAYFKQKLLKQLKFINYSKNNS